MWTHRPLVLALLMAAGSGLTWASTCTPSTTDITVSSLPYNNTGCIVEDDSEQSFIFTLGSPESLDLFTSSWADGQNGFAPILTLFSYNPANGNGSEIASDSGGIYNSNPSLSTCGARAVDPNTSTCLDAYLAETLAAGTYRLVLTEDGNPGNVSSNGSYVPSTFPGSAEQSSNFTMYGQPDFTGQEAYGLNYMFISPVTDLPLTDNWEVTIQQQPPSVPEPVTGLMGLSGLLGIAVAARRRRLNRG